MKQIIRVWVFFIPLLVLASCSSDELSRSSAKEKIQEAAKNHPIGMSVNLGAIAGRNEVAYLVGGAQPCQTKNTGNSKGQDEDFFTNLASDGYIKKIDYNYKIPTANGAPIRYRKGFTCDMTEKGKKELLLNPESKRINRSSVSIRVGKPIISEVTGISYSQDKTQAKVMFNYSVELDSAIGYAIPDGFAGNDQYLQKVFNKQALKGVALMVRYDDGWRIEAADFKHNDKVY